VIVIDCPYQPSHTHEYPDDWQFGGADGLHPGADPRWRATTYRYYDVRLMQVFMTQEFLCDDEAIDKFTRVAKFAKPVWLEACRPDGTREMLPWLYDAETDEVTRLVRA
jgi:hypothetical protein